MSKCEPNLPNDEKFLVEPQLFLGDDDFPLSLDLMKPHPETQDKGYKERIFNGRLSRARRVSETEFIILSARYRIFRKIMLLDSSKADIIVTTCTCLYNSLFLELGETSYKTIYHSTVGK